MFLAGAPADLDQGAALGAGAAVAAVAVNAALGLVPASWRRTAARGRGQVRWVAYAVAGGAAAATVGTFLVLVLLGCGLAEVAVVGSGSDRRTRCTASWSPCSAWR